MNRQKRIKNNQMMNDLCKTVKELVNKGDFLQCESIIDQAMGEYPHAPEPHNLLGILLEKAGDHALAMKHFRAAWALDPTYLPAKNNMENLGTFHSNGKYAYEESDCENEEESDTFRIKNDAYGIGHLIRRL